MKTMANINMDFMPGEIYLAAKLLASAGIGLWAFASDHVAYGWVKHFPICTSASFSSREEEFGLNGYNEAISKHFYYVLYTWKATGLTFTSLTLGLCVNSKTSLDLLINSAIPKTAMKGESKQNTHSAEHILTGEDSLQWLLRAGTDPHLAIV